VNAGKCERFSPTLHYCAAYCDSHRSVCRPPAPRGSNSHSVCINATEHSGRVRNESYRPERALESGPGLGTLLFHGMPLPSSSFTVASASQSTTPVKSDDAHDGWAPTGVVAGAGWPGGCPCGDPSLCQPIRTPRPARDVLAAGADGLGRVTDNAQIDWDVVTIVADVSVDIHDSGLYCQAHKKSVRVLQDIACDMAAHGIPGATPKFSNCVDSNGTTSNHYYSLNFSDANSRTAWAARAAATVVSLGFDGVIWDVEGGIGNPPHVVDPQSLVSTMQALREALRKLDPGLLMGSFVSVNSSDVIASGNHYEKLVPTMDFFAVMAYDMTGCACGAGTFAPCGANVEHGAHCMLAGADAPYNFVDKFMGQWLALPGMQPRQVMMILPAVGFWFRCDSKDPHLQPGECKMVASNRISHNRAHNLRCGATGRGPGTPPCLPSSQHSPNVTTPRMYDNLSRTAVFNAYRRDGSPEQPSWGAGLIEQIWYDDAETIGEKVRMARDTHNLGGVGLYQSTGGYPDKEQCDGCMWPVYQAILHGFVMNKSV
jgi:hypothetical protein